MNDLIYNEIVATPGFELEFAVGTTYSLDAEIFLALSFAFARMGEVNERDFQNPVRLLEGIRQASGRIALFCNRGGLKPPKRKNPLFAMLDKCVFEVSDSKEPLANFHSKIWIIKERSLHNRDFRQIKLIVLSRNLTKDSSLDVAVTMTAPLGVKQNDEIRRKHEPLVLLLQELAQYANSDKRKKIKRLVKDIEMLGRFELDSRYEDYDFVPLHFGENLNPDVDFRNELPAQKMMVVSPFIDKEITIKSNGETVKPPISWMNEFAEKQQKVLLTRLESLTPPIMELYSTPGREVWVMSPVAEQNDILPLSLHAKMYFSSGVRKGGTYLWIGSANATHTAFYRNSEFLLRLKLKRGKHLFENFKKEFCDDDNDKRQLFEKIDKLPEHIEDPEEDKTLEIQIRRHLINQNNLSAQVSLTDKGYVIEITARRVKNLDKLGIITFAPIQEPDNKSEFSFLTKSCIIPVVEIADLSEFYILTVNPIESSEAKPVRIVIKIPTKGIPPERDHKIFQSLIRSNDEFLSYVEMMITDRPFELESLLNTFSKGNDGESRKSAVTGTQSLYESLLKIAVFNPEKLEDINELIMHLDSKVVPERFRQIAETFKRSLKKKIRKE